MAEPVLPGPEPAPVRPPVKERSELEIRWRQARNPPPPVLRAVLANLLVATVGGLILVAYDWMAPRGILPGGDQRTLAVIVYSIVVITVGSFLTYLWVELPTGASGEKRRSPWAALLGFFASIPILYLSLVVLFQMIRPALG
ncbi:MAG: hypothetical protein U0869_24275 [Chloroflexota bacterium]